MKANKMQEMSVAELTDLLAERKAELFNLRFQLAVGQVQNPMQVRVCRKDIARILTILRQRELKAQA